MEHGGGALSCTGTSLMNKSETPAELLVRKLERTAELSGSQRDALGQLEAVRVSVDAHTDIVREGDRPTSVTLLLEGFCCRYKLVTDGKRQITSFHIPGDLPDLPALFLSVADHNLCSLVPSQLAMIAHAAMLSQRRGLTGGRDMDGESRGAQRASDGGRSHGAAPRWGIPFELNTPRPPCGTRARWAAGREVIHPANS